jgi:hypothetical protein
MLALGFFDVLPSATLAKILPSLKKETESTWRIFDQNEVARGVTVPAGTNVSFHIPDNIGTITREVMLGHKGKSVRYWGYCLPANYDEELIESRVGLPGQMFLSEREREFREKTESRTKRRFSLFHLPRKEDLQEGVKPKGKVRHQMEIFNANMLCYIMTEAPLALGIDTDGDKLNSRIELEAGTNPESPDTDQDGISDGIEVLYRTLPLVRDTDGDGLIDGIEDRNWNGIVDYGETDPRNKDSDKDGICDGMCRIRFNKKDIFLGEDKNLNGIVDSNETDPIKEDSNGDGVTDYQDFLNCQLGVKGACK